MTFGKVRRKKVRVKTGVLVLSYCTVVVVIINVTMTTVVN